MSDLKFREIEGNKIEAVYGPRETVIGIIVLHDDGGCGWCFAYNDKDILFRRAATRKEAEDKIELALMFSFSSPPKLRSPVRPRSHCDSVASFESSESSQQSMESTGAK